LFYKLLLQYVGVSIGHLYFMIGFGRTRLRAISAQVRKGYCMNQSIDVQGGSGEIRAEVLVGRVSPATSTFRKAGQLQL
jgi:hypothetical protein